MVGKKKGSGPWYGNERDLALFEWGLRKAYPSSRRRITSKGLTYRVSVPVTGFPDRTAFILFPKGYTPESVQVRVDGPDDSPHRYPGSNTLCIWYPQDPPDRRWVKRDGLVALLDLISLHLFKEAWWRATDEWLGEEAPHSVPVSTKSRDVQDQRSA